MAAFARWRIFTRKTNQFFCHFVDESAFNIDFNVSQVLSKSVYDLRENVLNRKSHENYTP